MKCRVCSSEGHRVLETAERDNAVRRRRKCDRCGHRWTTWEREEAAPIDREAIHATIAALQALAGRE
jgi:transcriptional repressor NrdR